MSVRTNFLSGEPTPPATKARLEGPCTVGRSGSWHRPVFLRTFLELFLQAFLLVSP